MFSRTYVFVGDRDTVVTREEVAKRCGVSAMTVTRVVSGKGYVKASTQKKVREAIEELGYFPNKLAYNLAQKKSNEIAIILPDLTNPYYLQVIEAIIKESTQYGYVATIFKADEKELSEVLDEIISIRVAGIVNYSSALPEKYVKALERMNVKVIRSNGYDNEVGIKLDYTKAISDAVGVLKNKGVKDVLFVSGMSREYSNIDPKVSIFIKCMSEHGLSVDENSIIYGNYPKEKAFIVGYDLGCEILDRNKKNNAVFCMNDMMAFGFISAAKKKGLKLPDDLAVIGFDNIYLSAFYDPTLSTISIDIENEAKMYVDYIVGAEINIDAYVNATFIERNSTNIVC